MGDSKRDFALAWAARGFKVFPLQSGGKLPIGKAWFDTASNDPATVAALWTDPVTGWAKDYNIGVSTDDLIVVDIDDKNGKPGSANFAALDLPTDTLVVRTPTGGRHVYYRNTGAPRANSAGRLGLGLDVRAWHGYVVAPGSETPAGVYVVESDGPPDAVPPSLLSRLDTAGTESSERGVPSGELDRPHHVVRAIEYLENEAQLAIEGAGGDATTFRVAANLKDFGVSEETAYDLLSTRWNDRCQPPWSLEELRQKTQNAYAYGRKAAGVATTEAYLSGLDVGDLPLPAVKPGRYWFGHGDGHGEENWLFYDTLPTIGVAVLVGPPAAGKTFLALELARCLYTMKPFFGVVPDDCGCSLFLYAGTEGSGLGRRLDALGETQRIGIAATRVGVLGHADALATLISDIQGKAEEMELVFGCPVRLIVLETLSASGLLEDELDNSGIALAMAGLAAMAVRLNALVMVTHHPPKGGRGERGGGAIRGSADYVLEIIREDREAVRKLDLSKARDADQRMLGSFTLNRVTVGTDKRGRGITSMAVSQVAQGDEPSIKTPPHMDDFQEAIDWALKDDTAMLIDGVLCAFSQTVQHYFMERHGSLTRTVAERYWKNAMDWSEQMGLTSQRLIKARVYFARMEIDND